MKFHTFGQPSSPVMLLIHGMLTPWQIWEAQIAHFCRNYYVIAAALDAHTEEETTEFLSLEQETAAIEGWLQEQHLTDIAVVCGLSLGGVIAHHLWANRNTNIRRLVLDGAPLAPMPRVAEHIMTRNYIRIIAGSRQRDPKTLENFKQYFLPERYLESFLNIADRMSEDSIRNIMAAVCRSRIAAGVESDTSIFFLHGTKGNEIVSRYTAKRMQKMYPQTKVHCFDGTKHCEYAIYQPELWIETVENWLNT